MAACARGVSAHPSTLPTTEYPEAAWQLHATNVVHSTHILCVCIPIAFSGDGVFSSIYSPLVSGTSVCADRWQQTVRATYGLRGEFVPGLPTTAKKGREVRLDLI